MTTPEPLSDRTDDAREDVDEPTVRASRSSPDRTVFTESGNTDGWIATDLVVEPQR